MDIYRVEESVKRRRKALAESALSRESADLILKFVDKCAANGLTAHRQSFYLTQLTGLAEILGKACLPNRHPSPRPLHIRGPWRGPPPYHRRSGGIAEAPSAPCTMYTLRRGRSISMCRRDRM